VRVGCNRWVAHDCLLNELVGSGLISPSCALHRKQFIDARL
jgi:hypothetical protein